jgi:hypothetical protein
VTHYHILPEQHRSPTRNTPVEIDIDHRTNPNKFTVASSRCELEQIVTFLLHNSRMSNLFKRAFGKVHDASTRLIYGVEQTTQKMSFYSCADKSMDGEAVPMSSFEGNVCLVVNVASK